jgi:hypothetical protein
MTQMMVAVHDKGDDEDRTKTEGTGDGYTVI